ncbi:hypothetical protein LSTR_LSTR015319 [Laodelphax striatellus]|uniref:Methionine aminopeptidase n=1 Tax=Laodelphax striatellus TaxID=195883 RepID=A0A482WU48_LAOST|nr:hypothetical protein LSTR_LSTR015319 [Laodelphax striatellus]
MMRYFGHYDIVKLGNVSPIRRVPSNVKEPEFFVKKPTFPDLKSTEEIKLMRRSCKLASYILETVGDSIKVGMTTDEIDEKVHNMAIENGAYPSPLNYKGFPKSCCTSVNNVACHGIPDDRQLVDGDIINLDVTVCLDGFHGDCSATYLVGNVDSPGIHLVNITYEALHAAISACGPKQNFTIIGQIVEDIAVQNKLDVISCFTGHGIGRYFHGPPDIYHCYNDYGGQMEIGMTFTIEPILTQGRDEVIILEDGWTAMTTDNARTAQWEHTILITEDGCEILT